MTLRYCRCLSQTYDSLQETSVPVSSSQVCFISLSILHAAQMDAVSAVHVKGNFLFDSANHRDFLGATMGCGIERSKVGDIIVQGEQGAQILLVAELVQHVEMSLTQVSLIVTHAGTGRPRWLQQTQLWLWQCSVRLLCHSADTYCTYYPIAFPSNSYQTASAMYCVGACSNSSSLDKHLLYSIAAVFPLPIVVTDLVIKYIAQFSFSDATTSPCCIHLPT